MNMNLHQKNALVCGASKGIGKACAIFLAKMGANVTLLARNEADLQKVMSELDTNIGQAHDFICVDVSQTEALHSKVEAYLATTQKTFHVLVNNTGGPAAGPISNAKNDEFSDAFRNHLIANHTITMLLVPRMKEVNYGRIINIISTSVKLPLANLGVSNTIRAAVANWSKTMANELAPFGITVNNVLPGATSTDRLAAIIENKATKTTKSVDAVSEEMIHEIPMKRFGKPEEIAAAVGFLASPLASYITGINVPVDGGRTGNL